MSTQTATGHSFPTPCKRCGGTLYRQVDSCPYCGVPHPLGTDPHRRTAVPGSRASATHKPLHRFAADSPDLHDEIAFAARAMPASQFLQDEPATNRALVAPVPQAADPQSQYEQPVHAPHNTTRTIWRVLCGLGAAVALGLTYVGYTLFSDNGEAEDTGVEHISRDARTTTGTIAPLAATTPAPMVAQTQPMHASAVPKPIAPPIPAAPDRSANPAPVLPAVPIAAAPAIAPALASIDASAAPRPALQFRDAAQAVESARLAVRANDLSKAQAALAAAQTLQPGNADAKDLATQLRPIAERRDNALQAAQACVAQQSWSCARQHANEALAIDTGNDAAKSILQRVIRETGWAPLNQHAATMGSGQAAPLAQTQLQPPLPAGK
ncbi:hypothetical protein [Paraburkholderia sp.]|uniref:hypothetical protein n=1 Tax=Paraburkholderia sp. TaxID=1926495 RepID=UPI002F417349